MNKKERSLIIDFGCCLPFGHSLQSVKLYKWKEEQRGRSSEAIVCSRVKSFIGDDGENFHFTLPVLYTQLLTDAEENRLKRFIMNRLSSALSLTLLKRPLFNWRAARAVKRIFARLKPGPDDLVIFPNADYYGTRALLKHLARLNENERPRIHLRFIGVLEFAHGLTRNSLLELALLIDHSIDQSSVITVSTEVPRYTRYLNTFIRKVSVFTEPYPFEGLVKRSNGKNQSKVRNGSYTILIPGTNRIDKGYFDLYNLAKEMLFQFPEGKLVIQDMKQWDKHFKKKYQVKLAGLANVQLEPAILPQTRFNELYRDADLILLHYIPRVYFLRGSAIHYEAIVNGIPVLARKGPGFIEEIEQWSSGWSYETKKDLFDRLREISSMDRGEIQNKLNSASQQFKKTSDEAALFYLS